MPTYALIVEYDGRPFVGWQRQPKGMSVQERLEDAVHGFCQERVEITGAGRTDSGVHATGQVAHLALAASVDPGRLRDALNFHLRPSPIAVLEARVMADSFHARFDAIGRAYRYRILGRRAPPTVEAGLVWHHPHPLDVERMQAAAQFLVGRHDFTSFRATACQAKSPLKTLDRISVHRRGAEVEIRAAARSFLHHQVRNIVGSLVLVGAGRQPPDWIAEVLAARDRRAAGPTAPASGLTLVDVVYPCWSSRSTT